MKIKKFSEVTDSSPDRMRSYSDLFRLRRRIHHLNSEGQKIELPKPALLNTLVLSLKSDDGTATREKAFDFLGSDLIISRWKKRELTPHLIKQIEGIGKGTFAKAGSHFNTVVHSSNTVIDGDANFVENSPSTHVHGDGCFIQDTPNTKANGDRIQIAPYLIPAVKPYIPRPRNHLTASDFYSYEVCPHRVWRDAHSDPKDKDPTNEFLKLLWENGVQYDEKVIMELGEFEDLSGLAPQECAEKTLDAMKKGVPLIYHGRLIIDDINVTPDILQKTEGGQYIPVDIKAAMALEGGDDLEQGKMKEYYAMQVALYVDALMRLGFATEKKGIIFDIDGDKVTYDLNLERNSRDHRTWWEVYQTKREIVKKILQNEIQTEAALFSGCKLCHWYSSCKSWCEENRDLSLVHQLGRSKKETFQRDTDIKTVDDLAQVNIDNLIAQKKEEGPDFLKGMGEKSLLPLVRRAQYIASGQRGVKILEPFSFPKKNVELFFDIEADPTQNVVYLHGVYERRNDGSTKFLAFTAKDNTDEEEKQAWKEFWDYVRTLGDDYVVYHYSHYERTVYRRLMQKYPDVVSPEELNKFFGEENCVDLYRLVEKCTDWPLKFYSIKDIAREVGFNWRDPHPSGASSIQWFNEYLRTKDPEGLKRIIEYNEDDCIAELVVKDYLEKEVAKFMEEHPELNKENQRVPIQVIDGGNPAEMAKIYPWLQETKKLA